MRPRRNSDTQGGRIRERFEPMGTERPRCEASSGALLVGRRGFEPLTFSVSGRRAPTAPTAQDDESLPDPGSGDVWHGEPRRRTV